MEKEFERVLKESLDTCAEALKKIEATPPSYFKQKILTKNSLTS